jgi:23S rRNA (cytosine1962-C5)-methyltransferase
VTAASPGTWRWSGDLPARSDRRLAVRVTHAAERSIRHGHPWVFDESITSVAGDGEPGDLAVVFDSDREFLAIGLFDPTSPMRIKVLHHGKPVRIDEKFWRSRLAAAIERRSLLLDQRTDTTAWRIVHGENDGLPGLVLDRYETTLVAKLYSPAWLRHLDTVLPAAVDELEHATGLAVERVVVRLARRLRHVDLHGLGDGTTVFGSAPDAPIMFLENGLRFEADVVRGQKTGHFLDQRENRGIVRTLTRQGARVLDVFSCSGGFSLNAAVGGATLVHSVDASSHALDAADRNFLANQDRPAVKRCRHERTVGDAFQVMESLARSRSRYDVVVIDPPSFASKRDDVPAALRAYGRLTRLGMQLVEPGGILVQASCSSRVSDTEFYDAVNAAAGRAHVELHEIRRTAHAPDHPIGFPEGAYLKAIFARIG